jgi:hypothetical protein
MAAYAAAIGRSLEAGKLNAIGSAPPVAGKQGA